MLSHNRRRPGIFRESALAHRYLDGLRGIEIGGSSHNSFGLDTLNIDNLEAVELYNGSQMQLAGWVLAVDIAAEAHALPFKDNQWDFVLSSHVLEHVYNPLKTLREWWRVTRPGGYIYTVFPHRDRCDFDRTQPITDLAELLYREDIDKSGRGLGHQTFWRLPDMLEALQYLDMPVVAQLDVDDKVGNGFTTVVEVRK